MFICSPSFLEPKQNAGESSHKKKHIFIIAICKTTTTLRYACGIAKTSATETTIYYDGFTYNIAHIIDSYAMLACIISVRTHKKNVFFSLCLIMLVFKYRVYDGHNMKINILD